MGNESPDESIAVMAAADARSDDELRRRELDAGIVCVPLLMRNLLRTMPSRYSAAERQAYVEAVKDIAIQVSGATMKHDSETGELTLGGPSVAVLPSLVDEWL